MSEPHEPSYYEIALTNRQVVVAFVILLVCLLGAFFSGVWIGRESTVRAQEQIARNASPPQTEPKKEGENLENLDFFDSRDNKKARGSHGEKQGKSEATPARPETPAPEPEPAESPVQVAAVPAPAPAAPAPGPDRKGKGRKGKGTVEAATTPAADTSPLRPAKPSEIVEPAVPKGAVVIQVFSSQDRPQADSIRKRLVKGGQHAFLSPVDVAGHTMYRVRIGPFSSRPDAQKVAEKVRRAYRLDTWVTE
ncbi:MAG: SPOR domain-containing protein [Acidobacteria bacterium]|nr:SPOR domain-containing protein [Acidobacteriota bacterium]